MPIFRRRFLDRSRQCCLISPFSVLGLAYFYDSGESSDRYWETWHCTLPSNWRLYRFPVPRGQLSSLREIRVASHRHHLLVGCSVPTKIKSPVGWKDIDVTTSASCKDETKIMIKNRNLSHWMPHQLLQILMNMEAAQAKRGGGREWICILAFIFAGATIATRELKQTRRRRKRERHLKK